ncbi:hypothetical protein [Oligella sp. HMSC09E12]|uniref:hypothetical protein n=1 Tax=Oligella sp. HMSC09E12 TaxID=1581147 RepID=UPI0008A19CEF|nr:hypothetical protein [Oligella sp. HMSC09E12]OFV49728.1 hypothetical protein HMPREF3179_03715 [Oligella sp. HMSC09E12]
MLVKVYFKQGSWVIRDQSGEGSNKVLGYAKEILLKNPEIHSSYFIGELHQICEFFKVQTAPLLPIMDDWFDQFMEISYGFRDLEYDDRLGMWFDSESGKTPTDIAFLHLKGDEVTYDTFGDVEEHVESLIQDKDVLAKLLKNKNK